MSNPVSIMTAIPYVNSTPHIGNVLTTLAGDVTARYYRMRGDDVVFQSGTDENGQKIKEAADRSGEGVGPFVDRIAGRFIEIFKSLNLSYDAFVRTTSDEHRRAAQALFSKLQENGHIYVGTYEGWYDVSTETYFKESELVDGKSPDGNEVRWVSEQNYFFRLSTFGDQLIEAIESGRMKIIPETRQNEVLSFIRQGLRDTCISRTNTGWGIPVPGDDSQAIYVWFDAVICYIASLGYPDSFDAKRWPPVVQWLGKDILTRFHATLWPAMLMGAGLEVPKAVAAHGWILLGGEKISKSKGNVVEPLVFTGELAERAGCPSEVAIDALRHWMIATFPFENDVVFTEAEFDRRFNSDLANDLGNALNRSLAMSHKFVGGVIPTDAPDDEMLTAIQTAKDAYEAGFASLRLEQASEAAMSLVRFLNKYIDSQAPWALAKNNDPRLGSVLRSMLLCLRTSEGLFRPIMPHVADRIAAQLGLAPLTSWAAIGTPDSLPSGTALQQPQPIFPRLDPNAKPKMNPTPESKPVEKAAPAPAAPAATNEITIEDFLKVQLKVGRVFEAEPLEGSDKLLKLQVVIGTENRQIVAGIRAGYTAEDLIGRQVIVVANLKPAKLRGTESQGMLLAAVDEDGKAILLMPDREAPEGAQVR
ncbi:MAG: methionine--tRNA ligase [Armatimonadetes bacterium]|nr:methionine--tRNA ligase [Armatimonadota bacterium]